MEHMTEADKVLPLHIRLRDARRRAGLTQAALATAAGCMQSAVSMMEGGHWSALSRSTLEKIAQILEIPLDDEKGIRAVTAESVSVYKYCPNGSCPTNLPFLVGQELFLTPHLDAGNGKYCRLCGEVLLSSCESCGAAYHGVASCCGSCGAQLISRPVELPTDLHRWITERQALTNLLNKQAAGRE